MEALVLLLVVAVLAAPVVAILLWLRVGQLQQRVQELDDSVRRLRREHGAQAMSPTRAEGAAAQAAADPASIADARADLDRPSAAAGPSGSPAPATARSPEPPALPPTQAPVVPVVEPTAARPAREPSSPQSGRGVGEIESLIGTRWLVLAGAAALFLGVTFLLKWSFDRGLFGPLERVVGGGVLGLLLWTAAWSWRARYRVLAHAFFGAGSCVLYAATWAAHMLFELVPRGPAFAAMLLVTAATLFAAFRLTSLVLAVLALVGGFVTPALLPAAASTPHALLGYATVLTAAALLLRWLRRWPVLGGVALAGTALLLLGWAAGHPAREHTTALLLWGTWFGLLFLLGCCGPVVRSGRELTIPDLLTAGATGLLWLLLVTSLEAWVDSRVPALLAALQAALFVSLAVLHGRRTPADRRGREGLWLGAAVLVAATAPLLFREQTLTLALALIGLLLLHGADRLAAPRVAVVAVLALAWSVLRVLQVRLGEVLPLQWDGLVPGDGVPFLRRSCLVELLVVGAVAAVGRLRRAWQPGAVLAATALLLPVVAGELMAVLVQQRWPHESLGFDRALAWAWPLVAIAHWRVQGQGALLVAATMLPALAAAVLGLVAIGIGPEQRRGVWLLQYGLAAAPVVLAVWCADRVRRRAGQTPAGTWAAVATAALLLAALVQTSVGWSDVWGRWNPSSRGGPVMAVVLAAAFAAGIVAAHRVRPRAVARVALGCTAMAPATVVLWGLLVPNAFAVGPSPPSVPLPMAFTFALPPALLAVALRRAARDDARLLGWFGSALALAFALLAWNELDSGRAVVEPRTFVLLVPAATSLLLAVVGPGTLRGAVAERLLPAAHLLAVLALLSREAWRLGEHFGEDAQQGAQTGVSICWALVATAALVAGIGLRLFLLRAGALLLFGLTAGKLVLVDLAALPVPYRVLSFLALGVTLMGCGYLYHRFAARIGDAGPAR